MNLNVINPYTLIKQLQAEIDRLKEENKQLREEVRHNGDMADTDNR